MLGIAVIVGWGYDGRPEEWKGVALGLASGLGFAAVATGMRGLRDLDPVWLSSVYNLLGAMALGLWIVVSGREIAWPTPAQGARASGLRGHPDGACPTSSSHEGCERSGRPRRG